MASTVFANGNSICCKAGPGASYAASPDPCWTPPQPSPVLIPYANTAYSRDLTNGTRTVFIEGTEVAKRDVSYFATSTGNEPATNTCGQGVATGVITGKAYFFSWSMNVKAEKLNVCRHLDMMGHNQASDPSDTPLFPFIEKGWRGNPCAAEEERIQRACKKEEEHTDDDKKALKLKRKTLFDASKILKKGKTAPAKKKDWHWTDDHCDGLNLPVGSLDPEGYGKMLKEAYDDLLKLDKLVDQMKGVALDYAKNAALKAGAKVAIKAGIKQAAGSSLPAIGNAVMALWTVVDAYEAISDVAEIKKMAGELIEDLDVIKKKLDEFKNVLSKVQKDPEGAMWDGMELLAVMNRCLRARKCNLVPYRTKDGSQEGSSKKRGCCPGQTGHHLVPGVMVKGPCDGYKHGEAPTVCVEGRTQHYGSHKRVHDTLNRGVQGKQNANKGPLTMADAIQVGVAAHAEVFFLSRCSPKCIKAQLEAYYKACAGKTLNQLKPDGKLDPGDTGGAGTDDADEAKADES